MVRELLPVPLVSNTRHDPSQRQLITVATDDRHRAKLKPLGAVHRAHDDSIAPGHSLGLKALARNVRGAERWRDALGDELAGAGKDGDFVEGHTFLAPGA